MFNAEPYLGKSTNTHGLPLSEYFTTNLQPIYVTSSDVPTELQMEIIDLQSDSNLN